ncbi:MAG: hypothetical protein IPH51_21275 [Rubrivivax sp.]|nr:hypothetical protein [Rubrivivax sp.]MBK8525632.1 hypothetical protein [Rubrivivax sp.]
MAHTRYAVRTCATTLAAVLAVLWQGFAVAADGLSLPDGVAIWPRWQARLMLIDNPASRLPGSHGPGLSLPMRAALLGDYDLGRLSWSPPGTTGRLRATSGLMFGLRGLTSGAQALPTGVGAADAALTAPYLGLGYTGWLTKTGLSFSADLGVTAERPGARWQFGAAQFGSQGTDAAFGELRLQPRLQLGVQYTY